MNKIRLGAFAGIFAVLAIIFSFMFAGKMTQNEASTSMGSAWRTENILR
jgi:hypothetical protein